MSRKLRYTSYVMLIVSLTMIFAPFAQEAQARCNAERRAANKACDDLDTAIIALTGAATV